MKCGLPALLVGCAVLAAACAVDDGALAAPADGGRGASRADAERSSGAQDGGEPSLADAGSGFEAGGDGVSFEGLAPAGEAPSVPDASDGGSEPTGGSASEDGAGHEPATCYDGVDDDGMEGVDCDDPDCHPLGSCCVGHGDCCAPVSLDALPASLELAGCEGVAPDECEPSLQPFGDPLPRIEDGALVPGGDASFDSGVVVGEPVDLTVHRLRAEATFHGAEACGASCLEAAGLALTTQEAFDDAVHVRPLAGLLLGGSTNEVRLVVADDVVARWPMEDPNGEAWTLIVRPTGEVSAERDGAELPGSRVRVPVSAGARLVLYGRNRERPSDSDPLGARVSAVSITAGLCDVPDAFRSRVAIEPTTSSGAPLPLDRPTGPSLAEAGGRRLLALAHEGDLWVATGMDGRYAVADPESPAVPAGETTAGDPELVPKPEGGWALFYTAADGIGDSHIARADAGDAAGPFEAVPLDGLVSSTALDQPTVAVHASGAWVLVARERAAAGRHRFVAFLSEEGGEVWQRIGSGDLHVRTDPTNQLGIGVGTDEISAPSLLVFGRAWHLYYARRVGTRWSIGLLASDELLWWRPVDERVLAGSGSGFDELGVRDPDARPIPGGVELVYTGDDGVRTALGHATRSASPLSRFPAR